MCEVTLNGRTIFFKYMNTCIKIEELLETKYKLLLSISLCFITLTGCNNNQADVEEGQKTDRIVQVKNSSPERSHKRTANEISAHLVELASSVPNVNDATAIVLGKYAIVGIDVGKDIDRSEVSSIK